MYLEAGAAHIPIPMKVSFLCHSVCTVSSGSGPTFVTWEYTFGNYFSFQRTKRVLNTVYMGVLFLIENDTLFPVWGHRRVIFG